MKNITKKIDKSTWKSEGDVTNIELKCEAKLQLQQQNATQKKHLLLEVETVLEK